MVGHLHMRGRVHVYEAGLIYSSFLSKNDKLNYRKTTVSLQVVQTNYIKSSYLRMCAFELKRFPTIGVW